MNDGLTSENPEHDDDNGARPGDERKRPTKRKKPTLGNPDADPPRIHREYVERHLGGGGGREPTPEAYEQAVEQWRRIPGAISHPPGEIRDEGGEAAPPDESEDGAS